MRVSEGEFRSLLEEHQSMVFSIALRLLGDRGTAEEVAQDVFLELYRTLPRLESADHIKFWLRRVAVHRATDFWRRQAQRPEFRAEEWMDETKPTAQQESAGPVTGHLEQMLLSLPEPMRAAIVLRYQEDMLPEEIAATLQQPVATVKSNLQRGLNLLRRKANIVLKGYVRERV